MTLSNEHRKCIRNYFDDKSLSDLFIDLYNYQCTICDDIEFFERDKILGFGRPNEHMRCYVGKSSEGFFLKIKTCESMEFVKKDFETYKKLIYNNNLIFDLDSEKYQITTKPAPTKSKSQTKSRKSNKSQEKKDPVLTKLKNRNRAKKFTLQEFNSLADWTYCDSFNVDGYIYTLPNGNKIECDSKSEVTLLDYLTSKKIAVAIGGQNLLIKYKSAFREGLDYYPDIVVLTKDMHIAIIEVKPVTAMSNHKNIEKYEALANYCNDHGYEYMMVDPENDYMTFEDMKNMYIPTSIIARVDAYLVNILGKTDDCMLEKSDIPILYNGFENFYKKGEFELYLHALIIQRGWYNRYVHGFMVFEDPIMY